jgi:hypothetical protein
VLLANNGLGPAIIRRYEVSLGGTACAGQFGGMEGAIKQLNLLYKYWLYSVQVGQPLAADETKSLLELRQEVSAQEARHFHEELSKISFLIEYESMYGEVFVHHDHVASPTAVG